MRLAIGGPTRDHVPAAFAVDAAHLFAYTRERGPWGSDVSMHFVESTYIHVGREWFLEASLKQGATHILWLDTDMSVMRETAVLLAATSLRAAVAASLSSSPTALRLTVSRPASSLVVDVEAEAVTGVDTTPSTTLIPWTAWSTTTRLSGRRATRAFPLLPT